MADFLKLDIVVNVLVKIQVQIHHEVAVFPADGLELFLIDRSVSVQDRRIPRVKEVVREYSYNRAARIPPDNNPEPVALKNVLEFNGSGAVGVENI
jgi:hypothetical protein